MIYLYLYTLAVSPSWGVADNTKETTKTMGVSLRSFSNDEGPSRVWMALLEQHSPSSPVFHNLRRFTDAIYPTAPTTGLPLQGNPVATADANQNCVTIIHHSFIFLARSLASLISILLSFRALFTPSIHPNLGLPLAEDTSFHSTTLFPIHSLNNSATPLALSLSTPDTLPVTSPNATSPFHFIFVSHKANTSILLLPNIHPISHLLLS